MGVTDAHPRHQDGFPHRRTHFHLSLALLLLLTGLSALAHKALHTNQTKTLRGLPARVGSALEPRAHSSVSPRDRALLESRVDVGLDAAAAGELVELVVAHLDDGNRLWTCAG